MISGQYLGRETQIASLVEQAFTDAGGADQGRAIGTLARNLVQQTAAADLFVFVADEPLVPDTLVASLIFCRLCYGDDARRVLVLGPVAVAPTHQGRGIGQAILRHGLDALAKAGVDVVMTYGDPAYYARLGFQPVSQADVAAPFALQQPEGWLGQSLTGDNDPAASGAPISPPLRGPCRCVAAFDYSVYW